MFPRDVMNTAEAAEYLGLATRTLEERRIKGADPVFVRIGRSVRYRRMDLDAWLAANLKTSTSAI